MSNAIQKRIRAAACAAVLFPILVLHGQFIVTNTNDSGPGSLRQAIIDANVSTGAVQIEFHIPRPIRVSTRTRVYGRLSRFPASR